jgi:prepilin-type processing-associated H-X9-DG protein
MLLAAVVGPAGAQEKKERTLTTLIEVTIRAGNIVDGTSNTVVVGTMTMKVDTSDGFTGDITPAKDSNGNLLPALVFRGSDLYPDLGAPQSLKVSGQINGRMLAFAVSMPDGTSNILPFVESLPTIFGIGTSTSDLSKADSGPVTGVMAGSASAHRIEQSGAVGTRAGGEVLSGDWAASSAGVNFTFADGSVRFVK